MIVRVRQNQIVTGSWILIPWRFEMVWVWAGDGDPPLPPQRDPPVGKMAIRFRHWSAEMSDIQYHGGQFMDGEW